MKNQRNKTCALRKDLTLKGQKLQVVLGKQWGVFATIQHEEFGRKACLKDGLLPWKEFCLKEQFKILKYRWASQKPSLPLGVIWPKCLSPPDSSGEEQEEFDKHLSTVVLNQEGIQGCFPQNSDQPLWGEGCWIAHKLWSSSVTLTANMHFLKNKKHKYTQNMLILTCGEWENLERRRHQTWGAGILERQSIGSICWKVFTKLSTPCSGAPWDTPQVTPCDKTQELHFLCAQDAPTPFSILPSTLWRAPRAAPTFTPGRRLWPHSPCSTGTSHLHSTIPSGKILIHPANHLLPAQELCLGEVYSRAGLTAFTSFLFQAEFSRQKHSTEYLSNHI